MKKQACDLKEGDTFEFGGTIGKILRFEEGTKKIVSIYGTEKIVAIYLVIKSPYFEPGTEDTFIYGKECPVEIDVL